MEPRPNRRAQDRTICVYGRLPVAVLGFVLFIFGVILTVGSVGSRVRNRRPRREGFFDAVWAPASSNSVRLQYVGFLLLLIGGAILKANLN